MVVPQPGWTINTNVAQQLTKKWTVLIYMNGANDLEEFGSLNMNQLENVGSSDSVNFVVQFKRIKGKFDNSNGDWGGTRRMYVLNDGGNSTVTTQALSQNDTVDAGDWRSLRDFLTWGVQTFPAEKYCVVLWNHGAGWRAQKTTRAAATGGVTRGFSYDDQTDNHIDTIQLPLALDPNGLLPSGKKWDLLVWDASLMQMLEVAYEIRNIATYIVGSEESPPGEGLPYDTIGSDLINNPNIAPRDLAADIPQRAIQRYGSNSNETYSALDASKITDLAAAVSDLGTALFNVRNTYANQISFARATSDSYAYPYYHDLLDFIHLIVDVQTGSTAPPIPDTAVQSAAARVRSAVQAAVFSNVAGSEHPGSNGLAIFLPTPAQYNSIDIDQANGFGQRYSALTFAKDVPSWQNFLINAPR